jgi:adenosylhomocysteine nucleosidase
MLALALPALVGGAFLGRLVYENTPRVTRVRLHGRAARWPSSARWRRRPRRCWRPRGARRVSRGGRRTVPLAPRHLEGVPVLLAVCGIGKVNAAALTQALLGRGAAAVLFTGVAGGVDPTCAWATWSSRATRCSTTSTSPALGYARARCRASRRVWAADPDCATRSPAAARRSRGRGRAGGRRPRGVGRPLRRRPGRGRRAARRFGAACAEMEGAAVAQVCAAGGCPWAIVRSVSDTADHDARSTSGRSPRVAAERAVAVVRGTLRRPRGRGGALSGVVAAAVAGVEREQVHERGRVPGLRPAGDRVGHGRRSSRG